MFDLYFLFYLIIVAVALLQLPVLEQGIGLTQYSFLLDQCHVSQLHSLFYPNKVKIIPHNIYELLTPVTLAQRSPSPLIYFHKEINGGEGFIIQ